MRVRYLAIVMWFAFCASCGKDTTSASAPKPPSKHDDLARIDKAKKGACAGDIVALQAASPDHVEIVEAIKAAWDHGFESDLGSMKEIPDIATKIESAQKELAAEAPAKPEKPTYEKPKYTGAWPISGLCRGRYENDKGIVIQANGKYYVVKEAEPCETPYVNGFVESTGETVTLALGREGREAEVVTLKDRETYLDDQKSYRDEVAQAQSDYQRAVKDYPQKLRQWQDEAAAFERTRQSTIARRDDLARKWLVALGCPASATSPPARARAGVDPDCYSDGKICKKERVADAEALDDLVAPVIAKAGWNCHEVRYVAGDNGHADAISVTVSAACVIGTEVPSKARISQLAATLRRTVSGKLAAKNVDLLQVTDGDDIDVQLPVTAGATVNSASTPQVSKTADSGAAAPTPPATASPPSMDTPRANDTQAAQPSGDCDEVSCAMNKYEGACCAKFKKQPSPNPPGDALPATLDRSMISQGIAGVKSAATACGDKSAAKGIVKIHFKVSASGTVDDASVAMSPDPTLGACVAAAVRAASFPKTQNGGSFSYPFPF